MATASPTGIAPAATTGTPTTTFAGAITVVAVVAMSQASAPSATILSGGGVHVTSPALTASSSMPVPGLFAQSGSTKTLAPTGIASQQAIGTFSTGATSSTPVTVIAPPLSVNSSVPGNGFVFTEVDLGGQGALIENVSMPVPKLIARATRIIKPTVSLNTASLPVPVILRERLVVLRPNVVSTTASMPTPSIITTSSQSRPVTIQAGRAISEADMAVPTILYDRPVKIAAVAAQTTSSVNPPRLVRARKLTIKTPASLETSSTRPASVNLNTALIIRATPATTTSSTRPATVKKAEITAVKAVPARTVTATVFVLPHTARAILRAAPVALEKTRVNSPTIQSVNAPAILIGAPSAALTATLPRPTVVTQVAGPTTHVSVSPLTGTVDITGIISVTIDGPPAINVTMVANAGSVKISRDITLVVGPPSVSWRVGNPWISPKK